MDTGTVPLILAPDRACYWGTRKDSCASM